MTGFGSASGAALFYQWAWELKSVNGKALDVRLRLPSGWDGLEASVKAQIAARFSRGNISANLSLSGQVPQTILIHQPVLDAYLAAARRLSETHALAMPTAADLLQMRGVAEVSADLADADLAQVQADVMTGLMTAIAALAENRAAEGARLATVLAQTVRRIAAAAADARAAAALQAESMHQRLQQRLAELLGEGASVDPARLAQEVALLVAKADVTEELDRLDGHVAAAQALLAKPEPVGRAFDFLAQEFNRETNTLCAKSASPALTRIGLDLKAHIDQLREQIQNVE